MLIERIVAVRITRACRSQIDPYRACKRNDVPCGAGKDIQTDEVTAVGFAPTSKSEWAKVRIQLMKYS